MIVEHVFVTPKTAAEWLKANTSNRPLSRPHVDVLCGVFRRGEMKDNGSTIKFSVSGVLLDGQHRLAACVKTGIGFWTLVVRGLEDEVFDTIDVGGKARRIPDVLAIKGVRSAKHVSSTLLALNRMITARRIDGRHGAKDFSVSVAESLLERHPGVMEAVRRCTVSHKNIWKTACCSCLYYLFSVVSPSLADDFIDTLCNGSEDLERPFNKFREGIIRLRMTTASPDAVAAAARAIKAFNAEKNGHRPKALSWKPSEEFPQICGLDYEALIGSQEFAFA